MPEQPITELAGYVRCMNCGELEVAYAAHQMGERCFTCFLGSKPMQRLRDLEVQLGTARTTVNLAPNRANKGIPRARWSKGSKETMRATARAQKRAQARLRDLYRAQYELLYAEERHKIGLPPVVVRAIGLYEEALATCEPLLAYHAEVGGDVDEDR